MTSNYKEGLIETLFFVREMGALSLKAARASRTVDNPAAGPRTESASTDINYDSDDSLRSVYIWNMSTQ